jgi:hypothetical protein
MSIARRICQEDTVDDIVGPGPAFTQQPKPEVYTVKSCAEVSRPGSAPAAGENPGRHWEHGPPRKRIKNQ